jgi:hypothetical protein
VQISVHVIIGLIESATFRSNTITVEL